ncbi:MAG: DASH family cryptochrome [Chitinophagaceae bacterium]|nr:DASH family cryptochrome [Chitinophagaceae bacterium]
MEKAVREACVDVGIQFKTYSTSTLVHPQDLPFNITELPDIFTVFRTRVEASVNIRTIFHSPQRIASPELPPFWLPSLFDLGLHQASFDTRSVFQFRGGETEAWKRLQDYFFESKAVMHYKKTRNDLLGSNSSSKFSPWLAQGCLSPRCIWHALKQVEIELGSNESTYWLGFELLWRDYFYYLFDKYGTRFFNRYGIKSDKHVKHHIQDALYASWKSGNTMHDFINANMIELKLSGFMSNRGRQNVASYFCHDLGLDWRYGAAYFEELLIDYDVCCNWGNWAYVAGVGNDPRKNRYFDTTKQANQYDSLGNYRNQWL